MMLHIYVCFVAILINGIYSLYIDVKIMEYFDSDAVKLLKKDWNSHKKAFENAVLLAIKETYGYKDTNVFVTEPQNPLKLSNGYLHSDNQVQIMLLDLELDELPHLRMPDVAFNLPSNVLQIESYISKMIVQANYIVFRNKSDIIYALQDQDPNKSSPFRFQQVKTIGKLAIVIEGCSLTGIFLTALNGQSVNLGHNALKLTKCLYTFEISTPGFGGPPVIVRYNTKGEGLSLEKLLLKPLRNELLPKLQAVMYSYLNTSAIFGGDFLQIRHQQQNIFKAATNHINLIVRELNKKTVIENHGIVEMEDLFIKWDDAFEGDSNSSVIRLSKMVLAGLDTLYSAHNGGPYRLTGMKIGEDIRFDFLKIRGEAYFGNEVTHGSYNFSVEIRDVTAEFTIGVNVHENEDSTGKKTLSTSKSVKRFEIVGWRTIDFAIPGIAFMSTESLITGYLLNTLPKYLVKHLYKIHTEEHSQHNENEAYEQSADENIETDNSENQVDTNDEENNKIRNEEEDLNLQENNDSNEENAAVSEENAAVSEENAAVSEENTAVTEENAAVSEEHAAVSKEHATFSEENAVATGENQVEQEELNEDNDDEKEHVSDATEPVVEPEESHDSILKDAEEATQAETSDETRSLLNKNDTLIELTENPSGEVDNNIIARQRHRKIKNKKRSDKTKIVTGNEV